MKQVLQNLKNGETQIVDVPVPKVSPGSLLIKTERSLVSLGTERMLVEFGKAGIINKARQQPDKVKQVANKLKTDGIIPTVKAVRAKLDSPLPLGYCNTGVVISIGEGVEGYKIGDRVVSNGHHAEFVVVPEKLCAVIPDNVDYNNAVFTVVSAIALQGIRLANPTIGETFAVIGLGLIGLLSIQILKANGCNVIGIDLDNKKLKLAKSYGIDVINANDIENPDRDISWVNDGQGIDGALITVATSSNDPVHNAAQMCRKRGRIILVGVTGLELQRSDFYEKELSFQVSCSYGPGRYDTSYEQNGNDYPFGLVRWTEQRNFKAILDLLSRGLINVEKLITNQYQIQDIEEGYKEALSDETTLGMIIDYNSNNEVEIEHTIPIASNLTIHNTNQEVVVGVIGAGNFTGQFVLPNLAKSSAILHSIASKDGISSTHLGKKYNFKYSTTDPNDILENPDINTVFITTRHNTHAEFVIQGIENHKKVFVEKPLAINKSELKTISTTIEDANTPFLMVGYNRRFSPLVVKMYELLAKEKNPKSIIMTVNAGFIPTEHWVQDTSVGGGRIIGEACHFIDLIRYLTGSSIIDYSANFLSSGNVKSVINDIVNINLKLKDGSTGSIQYFANGHKSFPKERLEVFSNGKILQLDNFKRLNSFGWPGFSGKRLFNQDKGHLGCISSFISAIDNNAPAPIQIDELLEIAEVTLNIAAMEND